MSLLVRAELDELANHGPRSKPCHENLAAVDVYSAVFTGVIDLDDAAANIVTGNVVRRQFHEA